MADPLLSFSGIASGIDSKSIIAAMVAFRSRPIDLLENRRASFQTLKSRYQTLRNQVQAVRDAANEVKKAQDFLAFSATSSNENAVKATADGSAAPGAISVKVNSLAKAEVEESNGFADYDSTSVGAGTIKVTVGTTTTDVVLDPGANTLQQVRDAINDADLGVTAQVVNTGAASNPYELIVTADDTGAANTVAIDTTTSFTGTLTFSNAVAASDANVEINGITFQRATNTIDDVVTGVTFDLTNTTAGAVTVTVATDLDEIKGKLEAYVGAYNNLVTYVNNEISVNASNKGGPFNGESTVRNLKSALLALQSSATYPGGTWSAVASVGLELNNDGTLKFDGTKFEDAALDDLDALVGLLTTAGDFVDGDVGFQLFDVPDDVAVGDYAVSITQAATKAAAAAGTAFAGPLAQDETLTLTVGDADPITVDLVAGDDVDDAVEKINDALSSAGLALTASNSGGALSFEADQFGSAFHFSVTSDVASGGSGVDAAGVTATNGLDVQGTIGGKAATGEGQMLTGTGDGVEGIQVKYVGASPGDTTLTVGPDGFFVKVEELLAGFLNPIGGAIDGRIDAIDDTIDDINDRIDSMEDRVEQYKEQLERRFAALEELLGTLQASQSYLAISQAQLLNNG